MKEEIKFTREDSERLVRIEQTVLQMSKTLEVQNTRIEKVELSQSKLKSRQSWMTGIGAGIAFVLGLIFSGHG